MSLFQIFIIFLLFFLTLIQTSFLIHFYYINIVLIIVLIINIYESPKGYFGISISIISGLFLDIFSSNFFGINTLLLLFLSLFIKIFIKKNVSIPFTKKI